jgi:hypothetical protein
MGFLLVDALDRLLLVATDSPDRVTVAKAFVARKRDNNRHNDHGTDSNTSKHEYW